MKTTSAVLVETGKPLVLAELDIPVLKPGQVLVEITHSGVCHTQVLECRGYRGEDKFLPHCLGHEAGGIVREISPGVMKVKPDDRVILSWIQGSGANVPGTIYNWNGRNVNAGAITTFSRYSVISENRLTVIKNDLSLQDAALLGCAIPTGVGSVFNVARPKPGQTIAIFGTGGVGLCAVNGAFIAGCTPVIAIDILDTRLKLAKDMGATHCINAAKTDPIKEVNHICPGGTDFAVESSGRPDVMLQALNSVRNQGGTAIIIGNARFGERISLDPSILNQGKRLLGTWGGDSQPDRDYPLYERLIGAGKLNVRPLMSKTYPLHKINNAITDLETGRVARPIIDMTNE